MSSAIYAFKNFVDEKKIPNGGVIKREDLFSFLLVETKHSPHTVRDSMYFFTTLKFLEKKDKESFILNKKKLEEFLERDA